MQRVPWPTEYKGAHPHLKYLVGGDEFELLYINMTVPNNNGTWPEDLGGRIYPPERAETSKQFHAQLLDDCPDCPRMPDHEDGADWEAAQAVASESYLFAPQWLVTGWWHRGRLGLWDGHLSRGTKPRSAIGHVHWVQVGFLQGT